MPRFEVTGGNGRGATVPQIRAALRAAGAQDVRKRRAFGMSNQPDVATFRADSDADARFICKAACAVLWPGDESIMANLIAYPYDA